MPTKTEQSDLYQAVYGRNGDTPLPVVACRSPADCFDTAIEAVRIALRHMTPVILLTDGYLANASQLWAIPDIDTYPAIDHHRPAPGQIDSIPGNVFERDPATYARVWAAPGDDRYVYRVGGIEKDIDTGNISYDPANHQAMTDLRREKIASVADFIEDQEIDQGESGGVAVVAWGSTGGTIYQAVKNCLGQGLAVAHIHLRHMNPLPKNLGELLSQFQTVLVPELNDGQLATLLRDKLLVDVVQFNKVTGQPFTVTEVAEKIQTLAPKLLREAPAVSEGGQP